MRDHEGKGPPQRIQKVTTEAMQNGTCEAYRVSREHDQGVRRLRYPSVSCLASVRVS